MAVTFAVSAVFKGVDRMSKVFGKMSANGSKAFNKIGGALERFNRKTAKFQKFAAKAAGFIGIAGGALMVKNAIGGAISKGVEFEKTMVGASVKFVDGAKRGTKAFENLKMAASEVGATTEFTAVQAAQGLDFLAMAGFNSTQAVAALPGVVDLATAANIDLAGATDMASDSLGAFNLMTKDSEQLTKNLARVNDVMAKTTTTANTTMESMFETIKNAAPIATAAGASIEEFAALTGLLANAGIKGTMAGTTLKNMFLNLQAPTARQEILLERMGVQIKDATGKMLPMANILGQLNEKTAKMSDVQKNATIATLFGKRAVAGSIILMQAGQKTIEGYTKQLQNATGSTKDMAAEMRNTREGQIAIMNSALEDLQLKLFTALAPAFDFVIEKVTTFAGKISKFTQENPTTTKLIGIMAFTLGGLAIAIVAVGAAMWLYNTAMKSVILFTKAWAAAQFVLNAIMTANPIGILIVAIAALAAAAGLIYMHWEPIKEFFANLWSDIGTIFDYWVTEIKGTFNTIANLINKIPGMAGTFDVNENINDNRRKQEIVNPQMTAAKTIQESTYQSFAEVRIKDETGRAEIKQDNESKGFISMQRTAAAQ